MISIEFNADAVERNIDHRTAEINGNLTSIGYISRSFLSYQVGMADIEVPFDYL